MRTHYLLLSAIRALVCFLALGLGGITDPPATASNSVPDIQAISGVSIDQLAKTLLPAYELQERRLSEVGIGYHYIFGNRNSTVVVTAALFATANEARTAAELSHSLMPNKPNDEKGIGDQAWIWDDPRGSAVRFRLGRCLIRIAGKMKIEECRNLARRFAMQLAADAALVKDVQTNDAPRLRVSGLDSKMKIGQRYSVEITLDNNFKTNPFVTGIWVSQGSFSHARKPNCFTFSATGSPKTITVRCFAVFDDNVVIVETRQVTLIQDR
jgi:hypothetical protein